MGTERRHSRGASGEAVMPLKMLDTQVPRGPASMSGDKHKELKPGLEPPLVHQRS